VIVVPNAGPLIYLAGDAWFEVQDVVPDPGLAQSLDRGGAAAIPLAARLGATLCATTQVKSLQTDHTQRLNLNLAIVREDAVRLYCR